VLASRTPAWHKRAVNIERLSQLSPGETLPHATNHFGLSRNLPEGRPGRTDLYGLVPRRDHAQSRADVTYDFTTGGS
jgi:hypothetical protein